MERKQVKDFLLSEIKREQEKIKTLGKKKGEAEDARTSWSSHQIQDLEQEISQHEFYLTRCRNILRSLKNTTPSKEIGIGSVVTLSVEGDITEYLIVKENGGPLGRHSILSIRSLVGKAILGKQTGEKIKVRAPQGVMSIEILKVA